MSFGQVEVVHRPGEVEVAVGIEAFDEPFALVMQVAFDLEFGFASEIVGEAVAALQPPPEFLFEGRFGDCLLFISEVSVDERVSFCDFVNNGISMLLQDFNNK